MEPSYKGVTVDTRYTPLANLLQYVEGSKWTVTYYSQVLGESSELQPQDINVSPVYQQYLRIEAMELRVTSPLAYSSDPETNYSILEGTATTLPGWKPNQGDMFLADIGDGREAIFVVTQAESRSFMKDALYSISYEVVGYSDADTTRLVDLENKTIRRTRFVKEFYHYGQNPLITDEDYLARVDLLEAKRQLIQMYMADFMSVEENTLLVPGQVKPTYDPYLVEFISKLISADEAPEIMRLRQPNVLGLKQMRKSTIWDCLADLSYPLVHNCTWKTFLVESRYFRGYATYSGVYYTSIGYVVAPQDRRTDVDVPYDRSCNVGVSVGAPVVFGGRRYDDITRLLPGTELSMFDYTESVDEGLPYVTRIVDHEGYYVFSEAFYRGQEVTSHLERLVRAMLRMESVDTRTLKILATKALSWENLERFYYTPVILTLINTYTRAN